MGNFISIISDLSQKEVFFDTWGHLISKRNIKHFGELVFSLTQYGDIVIISSKFDTIEDSPWFYSDMMEFIEKKSDNKFGEILKFVGYYIKFKNDNYRFTGKIRKINTNE